jgi:hypothetical protein
MDKAVVNDCKKAFGNKKLISIVFSAFLCLAAAITLFIVLGIKSSGAENPPEIKLLSIEATNQPNKLEYFEGEYFDFLGLSIKANFNNNTSATVTEWDWDKKNLLNTTDKIVTINYLGKTCTVGITVAVPKTADEKLEVIKNVENLLPKIDERNIDGAKYLLELYDELDNLTPEQEQHRNELRDKVNEVVSGMAEPEEEVFHISFAIFNGLNFTDIDFGANQTEYQNTSGAVTLNNASSEIAISQGYEFKKWTDGFGNDVVTLQNLESDMTYYAVFELTAMVRLKIIDYIDKTTIYTNKEINRVQNSVSVLGSITNDVKTQSDKLPIAFYAEIDGNFVAINDFITTTGAEVVLYVLVVDYAIVGMETAQDIFASYSFDYTDNGIAHIVQNVMTIATNYELPVGAVLNIEAVGLKISAIKANDVTIATRNGALPATASINITSSSPLAITFEHASAIITNVMFSDGTNAKTYPYPDGWNGLLNTADLGNIEVVFGEDNETYINKYIIGNDELLFSDLASYQFTDDTAVIIRKIVNVFTLTIQYDGGKLTLPNLVGKRALGESLALQTGILAKTFLELFDNETFYTASDFQSIITKQQILSTFIVSDLTVYTAWQGFPESTINELYGAADYTTQNFVGAWTSLFSKNNDILSSTLTLIENGEYTYICRQNGITVANITGIYRLENDRISIKTLTLDGNYKTLISAGELEIDIKYTEDGLLRVPFFIVTGTRVIWFSHTLIRDQVRPIKYIGKDFVGVYTRTVTNENTIQTLAVTLKENGTVTIHGTVTIDDILEAETIETAYYRTIDGQIYLCSNGILGTQNITTFLSECIKEAV